MILLVFWIKNSSSILFPLSPPLLLGHIHKTRLVKLLINTKKSISCARSIEWTYKIISGFLYPTYLIYWLNPNVIFTLEVRGLHSHPLFTFHLRSWSLGHKKALVLFSLKKEKEKEKKKALVLEPCFQIKTICSLTLFKSTSVNEKNSSIVEDSLWWAGENYWWQIYEYKLKLVVKVYFILFY